MLLNFVYSNGIKVIKNFLRVHILIRIFFQVEEQKLKEVNPNFLILFFTFSVFLNVLISQIDCLFDNNLVGFRVSFFIMVVIKIMLIIMGPKIYRDDFIF